MRLKLNVFYKKPPLLGRSQMLARLCRAVQMRVGIYIYRLRLEPPPENLSFAMLNLIFYPPPWRGYEHDFFNKRFLSVFGAKICTIHFKNYNTF